MALTASSEAAADRLESPVAGVVSLRRAGAEDAPLQRELCLAGRPELRGLPQSLVDLQLRAQTQQFDRDFPGHVDSIVESGPPVGRCWIWRGPTEHRLLDIVVLERFRCLGIGRAALDLVAQQAQRHGVPVRLSVWAANEGACRLYDRAGFEAYAEGNGYLFMHRLPTAAGVST